MRFERTEGKTRRIIRTNYTANAHDEVTQVWTKDGWWNISIERVKQPQEDTMTATERLAAFATTMGTTVEAIKTHSKATDRNTRDLWEAKQAGATDTELIAIATRK